MSRERLQALREELARQQVHAFLVPRGDEYQNEYVPASDERLAWLTGFTGSAGMAAVGLAHAALFVDGRYTLQAQQELGDQPIDQENLDINAIADWLCDQLKAGEALGYDPRLHTEPGLALLQKRLGERDIALRPLEQNPIDAVWRDRPATPCGTARPHPHTFTGEHSAEKRKRIAALLADKRADALWLPNPEVCAWLFNIRGDDVPHLPVALASALLYRDHPLSGARSRQRGADRAPEQRRRACQRQGGTVRRRQAPPCVKNLGGPGHHQLLDTTAPARAGNRTAAGARPDHRRQGAQERGGAGRQPRRPRARRRRTVRIPRRAAGRCGGRRGR